MRSSSKFVFALTIAAGLATFAGGADAAGKKDKDVQKLIDQAIDGDYLGTEYDKAETKLKKALDTCNKDKDNCSPELLGKVHVGLATVHGGQGKLDVSKGDPVNALKADPDAKLLADYTTPELEAKFKEAQAEVAGGGTGGDAGSGGAGGDGGKGGGTAPPVASDFEHKPVAESPINTPVPVFAEVPEDLGATKVIARYKPYGGAKWESVTLEKMEGGFGGLIPCAAVTGAGELRYFISASDESGVLAAAGSLKAPFKVTIKAKVKGDKPSLPGKDPPKKCAAVEDCPPGLAGCAGSADGKPLDAICDATPECATGLICLNGLCAPGGETPPGEKKGTQHVISLGLQIDAAYVSDGANVCSAESSASYICTHAEDRGGILEGEQFFGRPSDVSGTNGISGGLAFGGVRILAGYDYFFDFGLGLGARVGYAIGGPTLGDEEPGEGNGYPKGKSYLPFHGEARASWKFLNPNPEAGDFAPHVFVGGGYGQVNASVPVTVCDDLAPEPGDNPDCPGLTRVNAYQLAGLGFITFGGGLTYMIVRNFGVSAEAKFMVLVPTVGFTISPTISPVVAF